MTRKLHEEYPEEEEMIPLDDFYKYYFTFDLGCAAALISVGFDLVSLNRENPRKVQFKFLRKDELDETVDEYWAITLEVPARTLFDNTKMLKNRIYSD